MELSDEQKAIVEAPLDVVENNTEFAIFKEAKGLENFTYYVMGLGKKS